MDKASLSGNKNNVNKHHLDPSISYPLVSFPDMSGEIMHGYILLAVWAVGLLPQVDALHVVVEELLCLKLRTAYQFKLFFLPWFQFGIHMIHSITLLHVKIDCFLHVIW